jgi:uncharacterized membrane protein
MNYKLFLLLFVIIIILDLSYLTLNRKLYDTVFDRNNIKLHFGLIAWIFMAFSIYYFVLSKNDWTLKQKVKNAIILGLCIYAIYNFTNLAVFNFWNLKLAIVDTLWGSILFGLVVIIIEIIHKIYKLY